MREIAPPLEAEDEADESAPASSGSLSVLAPAPPETMGVTDGSHVPVRPAVSSARAVSTASSSNLAIGSIC